MVKSAGQRTGINIKQEDVKVYRIVIVKGQTWVSGFVKNRKLIARCVEVNGKKMWRVTPQLGYTKAEKRRIERHLSERDTVSVNKGA